MKYFCMWCNTRQVVLRDDLHLTSMKYCTILSCPQWSRERHGKPNETKVILLYSWFFIIATLPKLSRAKAYYRPWTQTYCVRRAEVTIVSCVRAWCEVCAMWKFATTWDAGSMSGPCLVVHHELLLRNRTTFLSQKRISKPALTVAVRSRCVYVEAWLVAPFYSVLWFVFARRGCVTCVAPAHAGRGTCLLVAAAAARAHAQNHISSLWFGFHCVFLLN